MTNAATRESAPLDFVGVDMAQEAFEWALHGVTLPRFHVQQVMQL